MTNYLVNIPSQNYFILEIYVEWELNKSVNGWDLYDDDENAQDFENSIRGVELDNSYVLLIDANLEQAD